MLSSASTLRIVSETAIDKLLSDIRASYMIHEHKVVMKERLRYLKISGVLDEYEAQDICTSVDNLVQLSSKMVNLILKHQIKRYADIYDKIIYYMSSMKNIEIVAYQKLHDLLLSKLFTVSFASKTPFGGLLATANGSPITNKNLVLTGKKIVFTAIPKANYKIKEWTMQGAPIMGLTDNILEVESLSTNIDVCVEFEEYEKS